MKQHKQVRSGLLELGFIEAIVLSGFALFLFVLGLVMAVSTDTSSSLTGVVLFLVSGLLGLLALINLFRMFTQKAHKEFFHIKELFQNLDFYKKIVLILLFLLFLYLISGWVHKAKCLSIVNQGGRDVGLNMIKKGCLDLNGNIRY